MMRGQWRGQVYQVDVGQQSDYECDELAAEDGDEAGEEPVGLLRAEVVEDHEELLEGVEAEEADEHEYDCDRVVFGQRVRFVGRA